MMKDSKHRIFTDINQNTVKLNKSNEIQSDCLKLASVYEKWQAE